MPRSPNYQRHTVCRGLARALYRDPGALEGRIDYSRAIEQEIEYAATIVSSRLARSH